MVLPFLKQNILRWPWLKPSKAHHFNTQKNLQSEQSVFWPWLINHGLTVCVYSHKGCLVFLHSKQHFLFSAYYRNTNIRYVWRMAFECFSFDQDLMRLNSENTLFKCEFYKFSVSEEALKVKSMHSQRFWRTPQLPGQLLTLPYCCGRMKKKREVHNATITPVLFNHGKSIHFWINHFSWNGCWTNGEKKITTTMIQVQTLLWQNILGACVSFLKGS